MSVVEDIRKLLQDIVTPDLKALEAKVAALDRKIDLRSDALDRKIDLRSDALNDKIDLTRELMLSEIKAVAAMLAATQASLTHSLELDRRLAKMENERSSYIPERAIERTA